MSSEVRKKEEAFGAVSAAIARKLSLELKPIVFASPICARDESTYLFWHPNYIKSSLLFKIIWFLINVVLSLIKGFCKILIKWGSYYKIQHNKNSLFLMILPCEIAYSPDNKKIHTNYIDNNEGLISDWIVFSGKSKNGFSGLKKFCLTRLEMLKINYALIKVIPSVFFHSDLNVSKAHRIEAVCLFLNWVFCQGWLSIYMIGHVMAKICQEHKYHFLFSPHEMHPYSRCVWFWASIFNIKSVTLQHSVLYRNKLSFFPTEEEKMAGLKTPDIFFVYSNEYSKLLGKNMPNTNFMLGASPRFRSKKYHNSCFDSEKKYQNVLLLVTSSCWFDVRTILLCFNKLNSHAGQKWKIKVRLHPDSRYTLLDAFRLMLIKWIYPSNISRQSLDEDLKESSIIAGCGSSVIFESIAKGIPTISIFDNRFINFDPEQFFGKDNMITINNLSLFAAIETSNRIPIRKLIKKGDDLLGLDKKVVDFSSMINLVCSKLYLG